MYELYDPMTIMFFYRNKHMMCDFGTGNNNKLNWVLEDKQELIDIIETIYKGAKKGRGLVVSPKGRYSPFGCEIGWELTMMQITRQGIGTEQVLNSRWWRLAHVAFLLMILTITILDMKRG